MKHFDVIVVGAGHAGLEAAAAAARMGAATALVTMKIEDIGTLSCNPAIGGLGKGHLVREVDALDGLMGRLADRAGIQFRLLNRRKGPAVQGPRAQMDRSLYRAAALDAVQNYNNLQIIIGQVEALSGNEQSVTGVVLEDGSQIWAPSTVITTGTFLNGVIHIGDVSRPSGRWGDGASSSLAASLLRFDLPMGRLKTGTPPRLDSRTVDWSKLEMQPGDEVPSMFSYLSDGLEVGQIACGITHTNPRTHEIINENMHRSALYGGSISGKGPRYCPSIEDKVVRFPEKSSHQVFLEPEGLCDYTVYPNGISTSLPFDIQQEYVRSMVGLENVLILQPGYAVEYDFVDPSNLTHSLAVKSVAGLFLAGQINGTTGYEEAAAQGLVAGISAALKSRDEEPVRFSRTNSYIGVMIDDLVTQGVSEPYRMFTSRAEFRLTLRADNADQRLTPLGLELGCVGNRRRSAFEERQLAYVNAKAAAMTLSFTPSQLQDMGIQVRLDGQRRSLFSLLAVFDDLPDVLMEQLRLLVELSSETLSQLRNDAIYSQYTDRQFKEAEMLKTYEELRLPSNLDYNDLGGLSKELTKKLTERRPVTLADASHIEGMTPAALTILVAAVKGWARKSA